jgi:hypothetical protein
MGHRPTISTSTVAAPSDRPLYHCGIAAVTSEAL